MVIKDYQELDHDSINFTQLPYRIFSHKDIAISNMDAPFNNIPVLLLDDEDAFNDIIINRLPRNTLILVEKLGQHGKIYVYAGGERKALAEIARNADNALVVDLTDKSIGSSPPFPTDRENPGAERLKALNWLKRVSPILISNKASKSPQFRSLPTRRSGGSISNSNRYRGNSNRNSNPYGELSLANDDIL